MTQIFKTKKAIFNRTLLKILVALVAVDLPQI